VNKDFHIREREGISCPNLEGRFATLDATRIAVSRSNGQRSELEAGGGIPCRPNPAATLLVNRCRSVVEVMDSIPLHKLP